VAVTTSGSTTTVVSTPVAATATGVSSEAYKTETSAQTAHGTEPVLAAAGPVPAPKTGPITSIKKFFSNLFGSNTSKQSPPAGQQKSSTTVTASTTTPQTTEVVATTITTNTTTATTATNNSTTTPPPSSS
jgi:hypothetical protein